MILTQPSESGAFRDTKVCRGEHELRARVYPGADPPLVLMHGFPDNLQPYDELVPRLRPGRKLVLDFVGWGSSDKPTGYPVCSSGKSCWLVCSGCGLPAEPGQVEVIPGPAFI